MKINILPYKMYSAGAKALQRGLREAGHRSLRLRRMPQRPRAHKYIKWGTPVNKLLQFEAFTQHGLSCPDWTTDKEIANEWIKEGSTVLARQLLNSHSGRGIIILGSEASGTLVEAPLYVKYKKKKHEYRVHVVDGQVLDTQIKLRKRGYNDGGRQRDNQIRNYHTGWIYGREGLTADDRRDQLAIAAANAVGLRIAAVDIIYNEREDGYYVLECNSAPGLQSPTLIEKYVRHFTQEL